MTDHSRTAKALEERAAQATSLAQGQALAAEADRLRRGGSGRPVLSPFFPRN
jgi:hypothetical protein